MLLLAAFLFLPAFVFFLDLIALSAPVFETMKLSLSKYVTKLLKSLRCQYLYLSLRNVKTSSIIFICLLLTLCKIGNLEAREILLSIGEHKELSLKDTLHYTIGNKEILASQKIDSENILIVKGKSQGYSEVYLKMIDLTHKRYKFTIISKARQKKLFNLVSRLRSMGLKTLIKGEIISDSGEIYSIENLNRLNTLRLKNPELELNKVSIPKKDQNRHISKIYQIFWSDNIKEVACAYNALQYRCYYHSSKISPEIKKLLNNFKFYSDN